MKLINSFKKIIRKERFAFYALTIGLIAISIMIALGTVLSIIQKEPWEKVEACVENSFLFFCLLIIVIGLKKGNKRILDKLLGELLAIYLVTNTTYFVEMLIEVINKDNMILDYIYLTMEFFIMLSSIFVFIDHLIKGTEELERKGMLAINIMLLIVFLMMIFDLIAIFIYNDTYYTLKLIDEFIYVVFGSSLSLCVLSLEIRRVENLE